MIFSRTTHRITAALALFTLLFSSALTSQALSLKPENIITVTSSAFANGQPIPATFAYDGNKTTMLPLAWTPAPNSAKVKSYVVEMIDMHPKAKKWVHLRVVNIPATATALGPKVGTVGRNSFGFNGYGGPQPPEGSGVHEYAITVYGLSKKITFNKNKKMSASAFKNVIKKYIVTQGSLNGTYHIPSMEEPPELEDLTVPPSPSPAPAPAASTTPKVIEITSTGFVPAVLNIKVGETVTFINKNPIDSHWPASNPHPIHTQYPETGGCIGSKFDACRPLGKDEQYSFTFKEKGSWLYHDHFAPSRNGEIKVE